MRPRTLDNIKNPYDSTFKKREVLLSKVYDLAQEQGFDALTRDAIAEHCNCAIGTINYHFHTMAKLRNAVMRKAVEMENLEIMACGIAQRNKVVLAAPVELKKKAAELLLN